MCVHTVGTVAANRSFATDGKLVPAFLALLIVPFAGARKMRRAGRGFRALLCLLLLALSGVAATMGLTGCGSNAVPGAATYTIQVMATSGDIQQATTVDLHLQ